MRNLTASLLKEVMQLEATRQIQAQPYERNGKRKAHRNGTRNRSLKTILGDVILRKPQFREFPFRTEVFARYSRVEESLRVAVAESFLQGVSTRRIQKVMQEFGLENIPASEVSRRTHFKTSPEYPFPVNHKAREIYQSHKTCIMSFVSCC